MTHPEIWLTTTGVVGFIFLTIFAGIIPIRISAQAVKDEEYDDSDDWGNALVGMLYFWATCILALFISAFIFKDGLLGVLGFIAAIVAVVGGIFVFASPCDSLKEVYIKAGAGTTIALFAFAVVPAGSHLNAEKAAGQEAEKAAYNQTVTYYLDANGRKLEGDAHTYPINSLRSNISGDTYTWVERRDDGTLATRSVQKVNDDRYEVTLKDDLPATDREARVERVVEYQVKGADVATGKDMCISTYASEDFGLYPRCDSKSANVKFAKTRTIIHIPAGSVDKMVPVVSE